MHTAYLLALLAVASEPVDVGFAQADITPDLTAGKDVWVAGYGPGRKATGVHDPLVARAVVLRDAKAKDKLALVCVDLVGLQYPVVLKIREQLADFRYVMVSSTHNHEGPDVVGIWGATPLVSGVDPDYLKLVAERCVKAVRQAEANLVAAEASYGTAADEKLLGDSRQPIVYDDVLRALVFRRRDNGKLAGILVQWNCHPESMGSRNTLISADFPGPTVEALTKKYGVPVAYFTGTVGGLLAPPDHGVHDDNGRELRDGNFEYMEAYGRAVARLAEKAIDSAEPITLTPFAVSAKPIAVPLENPVYKTARMLGVLKRDGVVWTGDFEQTDQPLTGSDPEKQYGLVTEVAYLRLGELHVACIPGEIYPELIYGKIQEPVEPAVDFPDAPKEKSVVELLPGKKTVWFGLANDEIGYIIPKRQWDQKPPFAYGRTKSQYGEINSVGPDVAPILMQALENRVRATASAR
ncbi:MAG: neutral/alkaline non-lysosomal ceramidase N-terminal domain-containing protein [Planctomycetia bacterium]|nr:neutral/alkaline non-lysosomal ceramidase N-terminal domain-containing protein [Planctomycetia bacterium]